MKESVKTTDLWFQNDKKEAERIYTSPSTKQQKDNHKKGAASRKNLDLQSGSENLNHESFLQ